RQRDRGPALDGQGDGEPGRPVTRREGLCEEPRSSRGFARAPGPRDGGGRAALRADSRGGQSPSSPIARRRSGGSAFAADVSASAPRGRGNAVCGGAFEG